MEDLSKRLQGTSCEPLSQSYISEEGKLVCKNSSDGNSNVVCADSPKKGVLSSVVDLVSTFSSGGQPKAKKSNLVNNAATELMISGGDGHCRSYDIAYSPLTQNPWFDSDSRNSTDSRGKTNLAEPNTVPNADECEFFPSKVILNEHERCVINSKRERRNKQRKSALGVALVEHSSLPRKSRSRRSSFSDSLHLAVPVESEERLQGTRKRNSSDNSDNQACLLLQEYGMESPRQTGSNCRSSDTGCTQTPGEVKTVSAHTAEHKVPFQEDLISRSFDCTLSKYKKYENSELLTGSRVRFASTAQTQQHRIPSSFSACREALTNSSVQISHKATTVGDDFWQFGEGSLLLKSEELTPEIFNLSKESGHLTQTVPFPPFSSKEDLAHQKSELTKRTAKTSRSRSPPDILSSQSRLPRKFRETQTVAQNPPHCVDEEYQTFLMAKNGTKEEDGIQMGTSRIKSYSVCAESAWREYSASTGHGRVMSSFGAKSEEAASDASGFEVPLGILGVLRSNLFLSSLLIFVPFGFAAYWCQWGDGIIFLLNFLAIVPMAWLMGKSTEDLSCHMGQITGGLLNAWFGNVVEMLLCIAGLRRGELVVVRSTLIGSILSNLLLVTGCSFLFGGMKHKVQEFSAIGASTNASLMTLSCMCLGLPTIYATILSSATASELQISRTVSFFLIFIYIQYLVFQLGTHSFLFADDNDETADLSVGVAAGVLICCSICCSFCSDYLVSSIEGVVTQFNLSKEFIGIILLPIVGNAAEHYTSVIVAMRNKMDLSLACAVGSSCQMALFVTPFTVLIGWCLDQPMSLDLHAFELLVLVMSVLIITSILQDGYSHWLEGSMLVSAYCVIAIIYFFEESQYSEII